MGRYLVTGGAGFIGSNFIKYILSNYDDAEVLNIDKMTYASDLRYLKDLEKCDKYYFARTDICNRDSINYIFASYRPDIVINCAAETHVDKSIKYPAIFVKTNVTGTGCLLDAALRYPPHRFIQISTDEVYGSLGYEGSFNEESILNPSNPYSASKAAAEHLVYSYYKTFALPVNITRCTNNYGPAQFPEKLLPLVIKCCLQNQDIPVYGSGMNVREWIHVKDHCQAIDLVAQKGLPGQIYNIGSGQEFSNIEMVKLIVDEVKNQLPLDDPRRNAIDWELIDFVDDRPGHDFRYSLNSKKIQQETGFDNLFTLEEGIKQTVHWYLKNEKMLFKVKQEADTKNSAPALKSPINQRYKNGFSPYGYSITE